MSTTANYENLQSAEKDKMTFEANFEIVRLLEEIKKLLQELVEKKGK